jgi:hypothetical protein
VFSRPTCGVKLIFLSHLLCKYVCVYGFQIHVSKSHNFAFKFGYVLTGAVPVFVLSVTWTSVLFPIHCITLYLWLYLATILSTYISEINLFEAPQRCTSSYTDTYTRHNLFVVWEFSSELFCMLAAWSSLHKMLHV